MILKAASCMSAARAGFSLILATGKTASKGEPEDPWA